MTTRRYPVARSILALLGMVACQPDRPSGRAEAVFAGGCFWGVEAVFEHLRGVESAVSGFAMPAGDTIGGRPAPRHSSYVEAVRVEYDPKRISYEQLLQVFFMVAHDPTQLDRQGPDRGPQYRSIVFPDVPEQRQVIASYLDQLRSNGVYSDAIVTEITPLKSFRVAPPEHQDYVARNPNAGYVRNHDLPKLAELRRQFPSLYE